MHTPASLFRTLWAFPILLLSLSAYGSEGFDSPSLAKNLYAAAQPTVIQDTLMATLQAGDSVSFDLDITNPSDTSTLAWTLDVRNAVNTPDHGFATPFEFGDLSQPDPAMNEAALPFVDSLRLGKDGRWQEDTLFQTFGTQLSYSSEGMLMTSGNQNGRRAGLRMPQVRTAPDTVSFELQARSFSAEHANFQLLNNGVPIIEFYANNRYFHVNGRATSIRYGTLTEYYVSLQNFDWEQGTVDVYVDGVLELGLVSFLSSARALDELRLYNYNYSSKAFWSNIRLVRNSNWLQLHPTEGTLAASGTTTVPVQLSAHNLVAGDYTATLQVQSGGSTHDIPVMLRVEGTATLRATPDSLNFEEVYLGYSDTLAVEVYNPGTAAVVISQMSTTDTDYSLVNADTLTLNPRQRATLHVVFAPNATGTHPDALVLTSNDAVGPDTVWLRGTGVALPVAEVSPDSLTFDLMVGDSLTETLMVSNAAGLSDLNWQLRITDSVESDLPEPHVSPDGGLRPTHYSRYPVQDDFESGTLDGWGIAQGAYFPDGINKIDSTISQSGQYSYYQYSSNAYYYFPHQGIYTEVPHSQPTYLSVWIRNSNSKPGGLRLLDEEGYAILTLNGRDRKYYLNYNSIGADSYWKGWFDLDTWHQIEFRLDWKAKTYDWYMDGELMRGGVRFYRSAARGASRLELNVFQGEAWFDNVVMEAEQEWLTVDASAGTLAAGDSTEVQLTIDTKHLWGGHLRSTNMGLLERPRISPNQSTGAAKHDGGAAAFAGRHYADRGYGAHRRDRFGSFHGHQHRYGYPFPE